MPRISGPHAHAALPPGVKGLFARGSTRSQRPGRASRDAAARQSRASASLAEPRGSPQKYSPAPKPPSFAKPPPLSYVSLEDAKGAGPNDSAGNAGSAYGFATGRVGSGLGAIGSGSADVGAGAGGVGAPPRPAPPAPPSPPSPPSPGSDSPPPAPPLPPPKRLGTCPSAEPSEPSEPNGDPSGDAGAAPPRAPGARP